MITDIATLSRALRNGTFRGIVLYEGPSLLDGKPVVAIANRIQTASSNTKTGAMVQTFIIRSDIDPVAAAKAGDDVSVCGNCPHRPVNNGTCYVRIFQSVLVTYKAYRNNRYARPGIDFDRALIPGLFTDKAFRIGSYGDPCAVPFQIWRQVTLRVAAINGYTHQWQDPRFAAFRLLVMASVDSREELATAQAKGWRSFRVRGTSDPVAKGEVICPASAEAGHRTHCASCRACGGHSARAKASITIIAHGSTANRFTA